MFNEDIQKPLHMCRLGTKHLDSSLWSFTWTGPKRYMTWFSWSLFGVPRAFFYLSEPVLERIHERSRAEMRAGPCEWEWASWSQFIPLREYIKTRPIRRREEKSPSFIIKSWEYAWNMCYCKKKREMKFLWKVFFYIHII